MARIYQAEHAGLRRQVALKVLMDGFARDLDGRERFLREARIAAAIKHPNVINIFDVGVHQDIPYLVMELLEGQDLERLLRAKGALEESLIIDITVPVLAGLLAVHDAGIVHRDLKPGNIFLARGRYNEIEPKLLDFGISKAPGPEQLRLTANRGLMGTPFYISPEGLRGGEMTPLSDQYSLGVVMYECATGQAPYAAADLRELSRLIVAGRCVPAGGRKPELSRRLTTIIERAMSVRPEQRFGDLREMGRELLLLAGQRTRVTWGLSFGDSKSALITGSGSRPPGVPPARRGSLGWFLSAAVPVALLFITLGVWAGRTHVRPGVAGDRSESPTESEIGSRPLLPATPLPPIASVAPVVTSPPQSAQPPEASALPSPPRVVRAPEPPAPRRASHPVFRGAEPGAERDDWALPAASASSSSAKPALQIGANDSPIFD